MKLRNFIIGSLIVSGLSLNFSKSLGQSLDKYLGQSLGQRNNQTGIKDDYQTVIDSVDTPKEAEEIIKHYEKRNKGNREKHFRSFKDIHEGNFDIYCKEASVIAAATLHDNGYPPLILLMDGKEQGHACFLYRQNDKFGIVDNNFVISPLFSGIEGLIDYLSKIHGEEYYAYNVINLDRINPGWIDSKDSHYPKVVKLKKIEKGK